MHMLTHAEVPCSRPSGPSSALGALVVALGLMLPVALAGAAAPQAVTNYVKFVGGKAGKANPKLKPVVIGLVNQQGGQVADRAALDAGGRDRREVRERQPGRHRRTPARAEEVLHQQRRGRGHEVRPADGERQATSRSCCGVASSSATSRFYSALGGQEAGRRRSPRQPDRRAVQARVRHLRQRHVRAQPVRDVREEHAQGEDRCRRLSADSRHRRERRRDRRRDEEGRPHGAGRWGTTRTRPTSSGRSRPRAVRPSTCSCCRTSPRAASTWRRRSPSSSSPRRC